MNDPGPETILLTMNWNTDIFAVVSIGIVLLLLLLGSALVSAAEVSFFSLGPGEREEIEKMPGRKTRTVIALLDQPKQLLATIVLANNLFNVGIIILGAYLLSMLLPSGAGETIGKLLLDVLIITGVILLFGEIIPKIYATKNSKKVVMTASVPIYYFGKLPPFSWITSLLVKGAAHLDRPGRNDAAQVSSAELSHALELTIEEESDEQDQKILEGIVRFGKKEVSQVMRPRVDVEAVDIASNYKVLYRRIVKAGFSRVPVYRDSFDTVVGILFVKDLLPYLDETDDFNWQKLVRAPYFVPGNRKIDDLLKDFQSRNVHMAIVVDEYGGTAGIVTLEDVLEEIVGDISDEFDDEGLSYSRLDNYNFVFEGKTPLVDVYKVLETDGKEFEAVKGESESLGGFVTELAGKILQKGDRLIFDRYRFTVESADLRKVKRVKVTKLAPGADENE